ncbi:MAG: hypothetical protein LBJ00_00315 [Planctomycetaceae bacterium]|nr:hypothetical protein [Planctomycetaceae bacterium]
MLTLFVLCFPCVVFSQDKPEKSELRLGIELSAFPDEVKFGDIVFLRYAYKNNTNQPIRLSVFRNISLSSPQGTTIWKKFAYGGYGMKDNDEYGGDFFLVKPHGIFEIYDAILIPPSGKFDVTPFDQNVSKFDGVKKYSFVDVILNSSAAIPKPVWAVGFALEQPLRDATLACSASGILKQLEYKHFFHINYHYSGSCVVSKKINLTHQLQHDQTEILLKFFNKQLPEIYDKNQTDKKEVTVIDENLSYVLRNSTVKELNSLSGKLKNGTLKDWIILNENVPIDRYDNTVTLIENYRTPDKTFQKWLSKLPTIQRNYIVINVLKKYYGLTADAWQDKQKLKMIQIAYEKNSAKYDQFLNDWLPLLPPEDGEATYLKELIKQIHSKEDM